MGRGMTALWLCHPSEILQKIKQTKKEIGTYECRSLENDIT